MEGEDKVYCHTCVKAYKEKKLVAPNLEWSFISHGYTNWKDATVNFAKHEQSTCHEDAALKILSAGKTIPDVGESLSSQHAVEKEERRVCLLKIIQNIRFLSRQGLALRGDGNEDDSNFSQLLRLRAVDSESLSTWLTRKTDKYTSPEIQNELLKLMALKVLEKVADKLHSAKFFTIMADETTDSSNREQVVICLRWVDQWFAAHEEFIGLHVVDTVDAKTIVHVVRDVLLRLNLSLNKARGQCYDGAGAMAGRRQGVAKQISQEEPRAIYTHCYGHALNLACSDTVKRCDCMHNSLTTAYEIMKLIKKSPKRDACLRQLKDVHSPDTPGLRVLCPTRWTVKAKSLQSIVDNYSAIQELWEESLGDVKETEMRGRILGVSAQMKTFSFLFGVMLGRLLFSHSDNLSRTLQHTNFSAAQGQAVASMTVRTLESMREDSGFEAFWKKATETAREMIVGEPQAPRRRKRPRRLDHWNAEPEFPETAQAHYRRIYFEAFDLIISCIKDRFDQPGYRTYSNLETLLLKSAVNAACEDELRAALDLYSGDFKSDLLKTQLDIFGTDFSGHVQEGYPVTLMDVVQYFKKLSDAEKELLSEVSTLVRLILVMPATNAVSERSFSAMRRIKTYLRSTMSQIRLNNCMVLHVHKDLTDDLDLAEIGNRFVAGSEHRESLFGKFTK